LLPSSNPTRTVVRISALVAVALGLPLSAQAADCSTPYGTDKLLADLIAAETALREAKNDEAKTVSTRMAAGLACLDSALPRQLIGRTYRAIGAGMVAGGDAATGAGWFRTATEVDQAYEYGVGELPADSPVRGAYIEAKGVSAELEVLPDKRFIDGAFKLDGRGIDAPAARPGRPHLLQQTDGSVTSWVIEGAAFPEDVLQAIVAEPVAVVDEDPKKAKKEKKVKEPKEKKEKVAKAPKEKEEKEPKAAKEKKAAVATNSDGSLKRKRPKEKTPLMIAGGVILGAAGGVYYMAGQKRGDFNGSNDIDEIDQLQGQINRLVIASGAVAAVGAGTLTWGIILDGQGAVPTVRVRF